jgi:hypothetical protein
MKSGEDQAIRSLVSHESDRQIGSGGSDYVQPDHF